MRPRTSRRGTHGCFPIYGQPARPALHEIATTAVGTYAPYRWARTEHNGHAREFVSNPLLRDRDVNFILYDVLRVLDLTRLPHFAEHDRATIDIVIDTARRFSRDVLYAAYKPMDEQPARFVGGAI